MLQKFQSFLIHLLGGVTIEESQQSDYNSFTLGAYRTLTLLQDYADTMYGIDPQDWCESMYLKIKHTKEDYENH